MNVLPKLDLTKLSREEVSVVGAHMMTIGVGWIVLANDLAEFRKPRPGSMKLLSMAQNEFSDLLTQLQQRYGPDIAGPLLTPKE